MKTTDYLIAARNKTEKQTDYALHKALGISQQAVSMYMTGKRIINDDTALRLAEMLGIDASVIIAQANYERTDGKNKKLWKDYIEKLGGIAASFLIVSTLIMTPTPSKAAQSGAKSLTTLYIMLNRFKQWYLSIIGKVAGFRPAVFSVRQVAAT